MSNNLEKDTLSRAALINYCKNFAKGEWAEYIAPSSWREAYEEFAELLTRFPATEKTCSCGHNCTCNQSKTKHDFLKQLTAEGFATWLDINGKFDGSPWMEWFSSTYCDNCEPLKGFYADGKHEVIFSYCEAENKCKFFPDLNETPNNEDIIKMWLDLPSE